MFFSFYIIRMYFFLQNTRVFFVTKAYSYKIRVFFVTKVYSYKIHVYFSCKIRVFFVTKACSYKIRVYFFLQNTRVLKVYRSEPLCLAREYPTLYNLKRDRENRGTLGDPLAANMTNKAPRWTLTCSAPAK